MDEKLRRAFQLAYFILREKEAALQSTRNAVSALDVMLVRQDKRIHYLSGHRTKVSLGEWQMLQRLVYAVVEAHEKRQEKQGVAETALVMHYLKHLVYITASRNSFFVALGLSRLLHNYTTSETARIHELVTQNPDRGRDDSYYRRRKAQLMRELQARFGEMLTVQRGLRGEERFQALSDMQRHLAWVRVCLREFTPWETRCNLPAGFDPLTDELPPLRFRGDDPDGEHEVEIRRIHALLHPDCFDRLLHALRLDAPDERLEVPQFQWNDRQPPAPPNDGEPPTPQLNEEDMQNLKQSIAEERERRKRFSPSWLRIVVDGTESARWSPANSPSAQIEILPDHKFIEIYGDRDGEDVRLAAHLLNYDANDQFQPLSASLRLEGGQQLRLAVEPLSADDEEDAGAIVRVSYRETAPLRVLNQWLRRLSPSSSLHPFGWKPATAFLLLAVLGGTLVYSSLYRRAAPGPDLARIPSPTPQVSPAAAASPELGPQARPTTATTPQPRLSPGHDVIAMDTRPRPGAAGDQLTRGDRSGAVGLLEAQTVYLDVSGPQGDQARRSLRQRLLADNHFKLTDDVEQAEIAIKMVAAAVEQSRFRLTVHLADKNGNVIWPLRPGTSGRRYEGALEKAIAAFSRELAADIKRLERK